MAVGRERILQLSPDFNGIDVALLLLCRLIHFALQSSQKDVPFDIARVRYQRVLFEAADGFP